MRGQQKVDSRQYRFGFFIGGMADVPTDFALGLSSCRKSLAIPTRTTVFDVLIFARGSPQTRG
jgi:hypothetical protein